MNDFNIRKRQQELEQDLINNTNVNYVKQITNYLNQGSEKAKNIQDMINKENKMITETQDKLEKKTVTVHSSNDSKNINESGFGGVDGAMVNNNGISNGNGLGSGIGGDAALISQTASSVYSKNNRVNLSDNLFNYDNHNINYNDSNLNSNYNFNVSSDNKS